MTSMTGTRRASTLGGRLAALEAERLAPVPRASHAVAVDVGDLAAVLDHIRTDASGTAIGTDTAAAYERLTQAARGRAAHSPAPQGRQELHWDAVALPDGQMLATAATRLLSRLSALAVQGDGRPGPAPDPRADKAAALTLIKAAHQLLCAATVGRPTAGRKGAR